MCCLQTSVTLVAAKFTAVLMALPVVPATIAIPIVGRAVGAVAVAVSIMLLIEMTGDCRAGCEGCHRRQQTAFLFRTGSRGSRCLPPEFFHIIKHINT